jgi:uncharacterized phage-like protein YoqJ
MKKSACSFTGHRRIVLSDEPEVIARLKNVILKLIDAGYTRFLCGGALGFDMLAAIEVLRAKKQYHNIRLILALPCPGWDKAWCENNKKIYSRIVKAADEVLYVSQDYTPGCMQKRNRYLIENSSKCVAFFDGRRGGTAYTVNYALKEGVGITNLKISDEI